MDSIMLAEYFSRIGLDNKVDLTLAGLTRLHRYQHRSIPFENLDVIAGLPIKIEAGAIHKKLVQDKRGGYCQELNGLLYNVASALGFEARVLLGRVHLGKEPSGRGHRVTMVTIDKQQWLVDCGNGAFTPRAPLPIVMGQELKTDIQTFRFVADEHFGYLLQLKSSGNWSSIYSLDMSHVCQSDLEYGNHYTSTSPYSLFTRNSMAVLPIENGTVTLFNRTLRVTEKGHTTVIILADEDAYLQALADYFGLSTNVSYSSIEPYLNR
ncbi:arylamine N-acetyltransferase [Ferrimonas lipolytica]|uniref:Arylamine N-acetyltransferase n=1 Tax=Ferrimonas lipolytica TaxID=2724191 RepID=A0A6H1UKC4_9GAMM|nr:arylamine N-acetyltransferase [Ferrimonas lipolytica]